MKKRLPHTLLISLALFIFYGCGKSNTVVASSISANFGNKAWQSQFVVGIKPIGFNVITLVGYYGKAGDSSQVEIDIVDPILINQADPFFNTAIRYYINNGITYDSDPALGGHGFLTVTSQDTTAHKIAGTFSGVFYNSANGQDSMTVANGKFNSNYTVE